jgi:hypothetical protein
VQNGAGMVKTQKKIEFSPSLRRFAITEHFGVTHLTEI